MKKRRRCNLCGAKLDGDICRECGYNNAAYDYHVNQSESGCRHSSTERYYSTEEHEEHSSPENVSFDASENWQEDPGRWESFSKQYSGVETSKEEDPTETGEGPGKRQTVYGLNESRKEAKKRRKKSAFLPALIMAGIIVSFSGRVLEILHSAGEAFFDGKIDPENVLEKPAAENTLSERPAIEEAVPEKGAAGQPESKDALVPIKGSFAEVLKPGLYVAGIHFPAGICDVEWKGGSGNVYCWKWDTYYYDSDYLYDSEDRERRQMEDLELEAGTMVMVGGTLRAKFSVREAEGFLKELPEGQNGEAVTVTDAAIIGETLEAGTYQVTWVSGDADQSELLYTYTSGSGIKRSGLIEFDEECKQYANLILQDGDVLAPMNCKIELKPAEYDLSEYAERLF